MTFRGITTVCEKLTKHINTLGGQSFRMSKQTAPLWLHVLTIWKILDLLQCSFYFDHPLISPLTPNDHYSGCTAPLTSKSCTLCIYSTNIGTEYFKRGIISSFFPSKCSLFHNSTVFGSCIIHILYTGRAKIKKIKFQLQKLKSPGHIILEFFLSVDTCVDTQADFPFSQTKVCLSTDFHCMF